ncbi:hypothetical protein [Tulasnella ambivirus 1]|uniref:Uncharacterized protein n=1 Tax=Tulasnella ambivirus 1 TaxID=2772289 RepID=A0A7S7YF71_9VIRU|nr:hypothetical protein [Tulasnella ambivirus 1]
MRIPALARNAAIINRLPMSKRSSVVKLCQAQHIPDEIHHDTSLHNVIEASDETLYQMQIGDQQMNAPFISIIQHLERLESPVISSLTLDLCRFAPVTKEEYKEARHKGWVKEISVAVDEPKETFIKWEALFDPDCFDVPIIPGVAANAYSGSVFRSGLKSWLRSVTAKVHFPRMTNNNISWDARREIDEWENPEWHLENVPIVGQNHLQRIYMEHGKKIGGVAEMRQRWYPANVKPRTYFAQGGATYFPSCNLQEALSELCDQFEPTHRRLKLQPSRITVDFGEYVRVYDLEAFSSRATEIRSFMDHLAEFCRGEPFTYMDAREGLITTDFGELLQEYNEECNKEPEISYERFYKSQKGFRHAHHYAGMLGVYGNIASCTLMHGMLMMGVTGNDMKFFVAGDDGGVAVNPETDEMVDQAINAIGRDQPDRRFRSDEPGCICLKRSLSVPEGSIHPQHGVRVIPPSLYTIVHHGFLGRDRRYRAFDEEMSIQQHKEVIARDCYRFLRSCVRLGTSRFSDEDVAAIWSYLDVVRVEFDFPIDGSLDPFWPMMRRPVLHDESAIQYRSWLEKDPIRETYLQHFSVMEFEAPKCELMPYDGREVTAGCVFMANSSARLKYYETLGFLEKEKVMSGDSFEDFDSFWQYFLRSEHYAPQVYKYHALKDIPMHLMYDE